MCRLPDSNRGSNVGVNHILRDNLWKVRQIRRGNLIFGYTKNLAAIFFKFQGIIALQAQRFHDFNRLLAGINVGVKLMDLLRDNCGFRRSIERNLDHIPSIRKADDGRVPNLAAAQHPDKCKEGDTRCADNPDPLGDLLCRANVLIVEQEPCLLPNGHGELEIKLEAVLFPVGIDPDLDARPVAIGASVRHLHQIAEGKQRGSKLRHLH